MSREDFRILEALADPGILVVQSPAIIAYNLDMTRPHVSNRLSAFTEHGLVKKRENGRYQMSDRGHAYLEGELDANDVELNQE
ncbi:helix-turn-helix domain-containing protein [Natrinema pallidum]|uniref:PhiH1 repressor-like protein n=1 Tax=Natrinema pallidum DSM 3751 TaxID=1227495 RepID=L9Z8F0_9EURY|nr:helix-turn-helix domain-containing protein [Natrinema pallidum]ELY82790.1 PhiH1 repressor-like protein [Natrinema pallidum DSM 3751]